MNVQKVNDANRERALQNINNPFANLVTPSSNMTPVLGSLAEIQNRRETGVSQSLNRVGNIEGLQRYGITPNLVDDNLDEQLAEEQGVFKKFGNAIAQAAISEVALGTVKGISDLVDFVSGAVFRSDNDYSNPVSQYLGQLQEDFKNYVPIYSDPNKNIFNGGLVDAGWWASNLPSVMSSLTLMIPSTGTTKGLGWLGRSINAASKGKIGAWSRNRYKALTGAGKVKTVEEAEKLNKVTKWLNDPNTTAAASRIAETGVNAALMRTMENYQEAHQVYDDMRTKALDMFNGMSNEEYAEFVNRNAGRLGDVDINDKEAVANKLAKESADRTFIMDYANTIFDVIQLNALRNPIKLLKNMRANAKITAVDEASRTAIGKAATAATSQAAEKAGIATTVKNFGKGVGKFLKDSGYAIKAEASEGLEEAINYIAQEEGMHYGKVALGEDVDNGFTSRLSSYMRSPELYDAAFWGVLGGVVFQGLGSGFNRISVAAERAYQQRKKKGDSKTGEGLNYDNFQELFETSENKRRIADINKRTEDFNDLVSKLDQIEGKDGQPGTDPFNEDENGNPVQLETETEKTIAKERAISEYITGMTFRAMDNGNFDMLKAYLQDANIRQALEEATGNEGDGGAFINSVIARMDHIAESYSNNLIALSNIARNVNIVNKDAEGVIPLEYLQIIARDNTAAQMKLEDLNARIATYETSAENKKAVFGDKLDKSLNYKDTVQLVVLTQQLAQLRARHKELMDNKDKQGVGRQIELDRIKKNINIVESMIRGTEDANGTDALSKLLYSTIQSNLINDKDAYIGNIEALSRGDIASILGEDTAKEFKITDEKLIRVLGEDRTSGSYRTLATDIDNVFEGAYGLNKIDKRLGDDYVALAALNLEKAVLNEDIVMNESNLQKKVNELHNDMLDSRKKAIDKASRTLRSLAKTYGRAKIKKQLATGDGVTWQNEADRKSFNDALEVLNLTSVSNQQLYDDIQYMLTMDELIERSQEAANPSGESSTTSQNQNVGSQPTGSNNQSGQGQQQEQGQGNTLNGGQNGQGQQGQGKFDINNPNNVAAGTLVARLQEKSPQRLTDDEIKNYLIQIDNNLTNEADISDYNKQQLKVHKESLNKELTKRQTANSSTGGQGSNSSTTARDDNGNVIPDAQREAIKVEIGSTIRKAITDAKNAGTDIVEAINKTAQDLNTKYGQDEEFKKEINRMVKTWSNIAHKKGLIQDLADVVLLASSVTEQGGKYNFPNEFLKATKKFVDKYLQAVNAKKLTVQERIKEGKTEKVVPVEKTIVSFESILRFANEQTEDYTTARYIYNSLRRWFENGPDTNSYIVLDNMSSVNHILQRAAMTNHALAEERLGGAEMFRIDIASALEHVPSKKAIDALNKGDKLTATTNDKGDIVLLFGDVEIGRLVKPEPSDNGGFQKTNNGWITKVWKSGNTVKSPIRDVWEDILLNKSDINNKINSFIYQIIAARKINADTQAIKDAIEQDKDLTAYFEALKQQGIIDKKANNVELINGLVSIWNYIDLTDPNETVRKNDINYSLTLWFDKLYDSYTAINNALVTGIENLNFVVAKISDGEVIQAAPNDDDAYDKYSLGFENQAFVNVETTELGVIREGNYGVIQTTANTQYPQPNGGTGSVWAVLPNRGGVPGIVSGHSTRFMDKDPSLKNTPAGRIRQAVSDEFERRIRKFVNAEDNEQAFNELVQFLNLIYSKRTNTPLLTSVGGTKVSISLETANNGSQYVKIGIKNLDKEFINFTINKDNLQYSFINGDFRDISSDNIDNFIKDFKTVVLNNSMFNADYNYFNSDEGTGEISGLAYRDRDGNFVITIPNSEGASLVETFPSFKHFLMQGGGAKWNIKVENESNFRPRSETNQLRNQVLNVSIEPASSRPVEENVDSPISVDSINNGTAINTLLEQKFGKDSPAVKRLQQAGLIPSEITYTTETLMKGDHPSHIWSSTSKKKIYVDDEFIKTMNENPDMAIRKLIHEQLHLKLHGKGNRRKELLKRIQGIVNDFKTALDNDSSADPHLREYLFGHIESNEERLEEFLVESLTNRELASYLNKVQIESPQTKTKQSLFDKILELLAEIFDWGVTKGSLYEKELKVLQGYTTEEIEQGENNPEQTKTLETLNGFIDYGKEHIEFDDNTHTYSIDGEPVDYSVTQYASEVYGKPNIEGDYSHSSAIGRSMDAMYRDFFIYGDEVLNRNYPNLNAARKKQILEDLHRLRAYLDNRFGIKDGKRQYTVITDEFPLAVNAKTEDGNKVIAGTMDMLIMDADGNFHIFDFKAKNHPIDRKINGKEGDDRRNYSAQQNMYRAMLESIDPAFKGKVKSIQLIWMDTFYPSIRDVNYQTDDNGQVTVDGTPIEDYTGFGTPHLKENVEESIISLEMSDNIEGLQVPEMTPVNQPVETDGGEQGETITVEDEDLEDEFDDDDMMASSVQEDITPSVNQFVESLPLEERVNFNQLLLDGTVSMKCN